MREVECTTSFESRVARAALFAAIAWSLVFLAVLLVRLVPGGL